MNATTISRVQASWSRVEPISSTAGDLFYDKLFELDPELRNLFKGDMADQKAKLMQMIGTAVKMLDRLDELDPVLVRLGGRHVDYGVRPEHYATVGAALLDTLSKGLGDDFTPDVEAAWTEVYGVLKDAMLSANARV